MPRSRARDLKTIRYRGGLVEFQIPASWNEEYEDEGGGTFWDPDGGSGTFRLNVLTFEEQGDAPPKSAVAILEGASGEGSILEVGAGNALRSHVKRTTEDGEPIVIHYWELAGFLPPRHHRLALFSYTVLESEAATPGVRDDLALLAAQIVEARFSPELGVPPEASAEQEILPPDLKGLARRRAVVEAAARARYGKPLLRSKADLALLQRLLDDGAFRLDQTHELQSLGIVFGDVLATHSELCWVSVRDEHGTDPALRYKDTSILVFPMTMISKRVEAGSEIDVQRLFDGILTKVREIENEIA